MGYTLKIGELKVVTENEDGEPCDVRTASEVTRDDAPAFGEPTDYTNERWPSYTAWSDFCQRAGLHDLFYDRKTRKDALLAEHPGCVPLTEAHRKEINDALDAWKARYPKAIPSYGRPVPDHLSGIQRFSWSDPDNPEENTWMTRLVWLHYWVNWALDNCENPVFANS